MPRLNVAAAGNQDAGINIINARFTAEALRRIRGQDVGVLDNSFLSVADATGLNRTQNTNFMWPITATNAQNIVVGRGMATAYGFDIQSESEVRFTVTPPSTGTRYFFIYLSWDLSNPVEADGEIDIHDNGVNSTWTPTYQDNLITNPIGKYMMPLYRLAVNTAGTVTNIQNYTALGVRTIGNPLRADYSTLADKAVTADTQQQTDNSNRVATTSYVRQAISDVKNITEADILSSAGAKIGTVRRQVNFVIVDIPSVGTGLVGYIPVGYRPKTATVAGVYAGLSGAMQATWPGSASIYGNATATISTDGAVNVSLAASGSWVSGNGGAGLAMVQASGGIRVVAGYEIT